MRFRLLGVLSAMVLLLGSSTTLASGHSPQGTPASELQQFENPAGPPVAGATGSSCADALAVRGVSRKTLTLVPDTVAGIGPTRPVRLPRDLRGGPLVPPGADYSPLEADYLNLLSHASGLSLNRYAGQRLTLTYLDRPYSRPIGAYACLETGKHRVVGLWAVELNYNFQPLFYASVRGKTANSLAGGSFLDWLQLRGDFVPAAIPDRPKLTARETLIDFFRMLDDPSIPLPTKESLLAGYEGYSNSHSSAFREGLNGLGASIPTVFRALVPMSISAWIPPKGMPRQPANSAEYMVQLWPVFRRFSINYLAGNGYQAMYFSLVRSGNGTWHVTGTSTGM